MEGEKNGSQFKVRDGECWDKTSEEDIGGDGPHQ